MAVLRKHQQKGQHQAHSFAKVILASAHSKYHKNHLDHLNHLYSLYLSLHLMILPEVTNKDRKYFDMLSTSENLINPKSISPHDLVF